MSRARRKPGTMRAKHAADRCFHRRNDGHWVDSFVLAYQKKTAVRVDVSALNFPPDPDYVRHMARKAVEEAAR